MKKHFSLLLAFAFSANAATTEKMMNHHHAIGWKIFQKEAASSQNVFTSPLSLYVAMTMTYEGSRGEIRKKASQFLNLEELGHHFHPPLLDEMSSLAQSKEITFRSANAIWTDSEKGNRWGLTPPSKKYSDYAKNIYGAEIAPLKFEPEEPAVKVINSWVEKKTNDMIKDFLTPDDVKGVNVVLVNAVYFKGLWEKPFEAVRTMDAEFRTPAKKVTVPFMNNTEEFLYLDDKDFQMAELPYKGGEVAMTIVLPKKDLAPLVKSFTLESLDRAMKAMRKTEVWVSLPKFELTWGTADLTPSLVELGMPMKGDFTDLGSKEFEIKKVLQKAVIKVDEAGSEAAAATAMMARAGSMPKPKPEFRADKPFLFILRSVKTGDWLFVGQLVDPK